MLLTILILYFFVNDKTYKEIEYPDKLLPNFSQNLNKISKIKIQSYQNSYYLLKKNNQWVAPEHYNYPLNTKELNEFLLEIGNLKLLDKKTNESKYHNRLGLAIPIEKDKISKVIKFYGYDNKTLYSFIIGNKAKISNNDRLFYIRKVNDDQSWIFLNNLVIHEKSLNWTNTDLVMLARWRIKSIKFKNNKDKKNNFEIVRNNYSDSSFRFNNMPKNYEIIKPFKENKIASSLELIDIKSINKIDNIKNNKLLRTIDVAMFDGLTVKFRVFGTTLRKIVTINVENDFSLREELPLDGPLIVGLPKMYSKERVAEEKKSYEFLNDWSFEIDEESLENLLTNKFQVIKKNAI